MITFFGILFILIGINAVLMVFSINGVNQKIEKSTDGNSETSNSKIYPIDLISSKYKKAV